MDEESTVTYRVPWAEVQHLFVDRMSPITVSSWGGNTLATPRSGTLAACADSLRSEEERLKKRAAHLAVCPQRDGLVCLTCGKEGRDTDE